MARIIQKNTEAPKAPKPRKTVNKIIALLFFTGAVFCGMAYLFMETIHSLILALTLLLAGFIACLTCISFNVSYTSAKKRYGDAGERMTGSILERYLPEDYTVVQNSIIYSSDGKSEIDNIVIGNTGVFILEVKNVIGDVTGRFEDKHWLKDKMDPYGIEHFDEMYNPIKQVKTHRHRLANYLKENNVSTYIRSAVYFVNPQADVELRGEPGDIPVFTYETTQDMINYIKSGKSNLSNETVNRIIELLN